MYLKPSRYEELNREVMNLMEAYAIARYPLDAFALANRMGITLRSYASIPPDMRLAFLNVSKDAFTIALDGFKVDTTFICYNQDASRGRLKQSIAHEIAHVWLEHPSDKEPYESEAEYFAAYLLAPIPVINKLKLNSAQEVQEHFDISLMAARIALERAHNRCRCGKEIFEYERKITNMCNLKGGDCLEIV